ncbi:MAG: DNA translocase FtsK 4TM domain-containing protein, partial [Flavobacteriaceae bacterium]|nr:DNA translocase FtsK 4TM domain-containing protein [Flavobacteriaceae bacterium]
MKKTMQTPQKRQNILAKTRLVLGVTLILMALISILSFIFYLKNWQAEQSQSGNLLDKEVQSSNILGKLGDWLGNLFIFESVGIAAFFIPFLFIVFGTRLLGIRYFKPWKSISHSLFFICWLPVFIGAITKGNGVISGVYGYQIYEYGSTIIGSFGLWMSILLSIFIYFVLEFD